MERHKTILLATPESSTSQEVLDHLSALGYPVVTVERGSDAVLAVAEDKVGLVILDISVEEPSGVRTVEILRKIRPRLPVIVLSGDDTVETGRQILQHGPFYYLLKPLCLEELEQLVRIAISLNKRLTPGIDGRRQKTVLDREEGTGT